MMRPIVLSCVILLAAAGAQAYSQDLAALRERAEQARPRDQVRLFTDLAQRTLEFASHAFDKGDAERGHQAVREVVEFSQRAADAAAATGNRLKQTEIATRRAANRLQDLSRALAFDDRQQVEKAVVQLQEVRSQLLQEMFAPRRR